MTTEYNPTEVERLCREAREDDITMSDERIEHLSGAVSDIRTKAMERVWGWEGYRKRELYLMASLPSTLDAMDGLLTIARTRNNLRAMADQLDAAGREIERLSLEGDVILTGTRALTAERDQLRAERDRAVEDMEAAEQRFAGVLDGTFAVGDGTAQREIERLRAEVEAAERWRDREQARIAVLEKQNDRFVSILAASETPASIVATVDHLEAARAEIERLTRRVRDQNEELTAHAERGHRQLMASMAGARLHTERDKLRAEVERLRNTDIGDALVDYDTACTERDRLLAEVNAMRPVVEASVRVVELDEICDAHPGINDAIGRQAESELYDAVRARTAAVDAYRAARDKAGS